MPFRLKFLLATAALSAVLSPLAQASVVSTGTRLIYVGDAADKTLRLTNEDNHPNLVQVWLDKGDASSTLETADAPFVATPQIFRMEPHAGQMVRFVFTGENVPQDRESVFYINFSQIPAIKAKEQDANKLVLMFSNRLKLFYRPKGLPGKPENIAGQMRFSRQGNGSGLHVVVDNPTPYHAVVRSASLREGDAHCTLASAVMISPLSKVQWNVPSTCTTGTSATELKLVLVNDFGSDAASVVPVN
jgi:fimbrial chaperone protein